MLQNIPPALENTIRLVETSFYAVHNHIPEAWQNVPFEVGVEGLLGGYAFARLLQGASRHFVDKQVWKGCHDKVLPALERVCEFGIPLAAIAYSAFDREGAQALIQNYPMHLYGIANMFLGGVLAAEQHLQGKKR